MMNPTVMQDAGEEKGNGDRLGNGHDQPEREPAQLFSECLRSRLAIVAALEDATVTVASSSLSPHVSVMQPAAFATGQPAAEARFGSAERWVGSRARCLILKPEGIMETHRRAMLS